MKVKERVSEVIKTKELDLMNKDSVRRCVEFTQEMRKLGVINNHRQEPARMIEGGLDQLKLYSSYIHPITFK